MAGNDTPLLNVFLSRISGSGETQTINQERRANEERATSFGKQLESITSQLVVLRENVIQVAKIIELKQAEIELKQSKLKAELSTIKTSHQTETRDAIKMLKTDLRIFEQASKAVESQLKTQEENTAREFKDICAGLQCTSDLLISALDATKEQRSPAPTPARQNQKTGTVAPFEARMEPVQKNIKDMDLAAGILKSDLAILQKDHGLLEQTKANLTNRVIIVEGFDCHLGALETNMNTLEGEINMMRR